MELICFSSGQPPPAAVSMPTSGWNLSMMQKLLFHCYEEMENSAVKITN
jgi:hypothetical protein